ncbi:MAG: small metal-binding protein SmbP [Methylococcales bacterium]|jgi:Small metal-binding protein
MTKLRNLLPGLLLFLSMNVFAEQHADGAMTHANAALAKGKEGNTSALVNHARMALDEALEASLVTKSVTKNHLDAAANSLQKAIDNGNLGHVGQATKAIEEAIAHLKMASKI